MSWKRRLIIAAALALLVTVATVLGLLLVERESQGSFIDNVVVIPLVVGKSEQDAAAALERAGLQPDITYRRFRTTPPGGQVVAQGLPSSRIASRGDSVLIVVATTKARRRQPAADRGYGWATYGPFVPQ
jgi:beta-lactam-binding protein with PASTA domain